MVFVLVSWSAFAWDMPCGGNMIIKLKGKEAFIKTEFISIMGNHPDFGLFMVVDGEYLKNLTEKEYNRIKKIWRGENG